MTMRMHSTRKRPACPSRGRGLTLIELMLSLTITGMVATAIGSMLHAVTTGVMTRQDTRSAMIHAGAAQMRLAAYIAPSRCVLDTDASFVTLWLDDSKQSSTVHATEVRWLRYNATDDAIDVFFVEYPSAWTQTAQDIEDQEFPRTGDWETVFTKYNNGGYMKSLRLLDGIESFAYSSDDPDPNDIRQIIFSLGLTADEGPKPLDVTASIRIHQVPVK